MPTPTRSVAAIATAAIVLLSAATAFAGTPTRLEIELPPDVTFVEPGERVDVVQVVGIDADGERVGFPGAAPVVTASVGRIESVAPPYRLAYTAPAKIDGPLSVAIEAYLPDAPAIRGSLRLDVWPIGPYVRLRLDAATDRVAWGAEAEINLRGETRDGRIVPVVDRRVEVTLSGPGKLEFVRLGRYRFVAPAAPDPDGRRDVVLHARVGKNAAVNGELALWLGPRVPRRPGAPEVAAGSNSERPATERPAPAPGPGPGPESEPRPEAGSGPRAEPATENGAGDARSDEPAPGKDARAAGGPAAPGEDRSGRDERATEPERKNVRWTGGHLLLTAWRVRAGGGESEPSRRARRLPDAGSPFVAREAAQRLRFVVLRDSVTNVTATARRDGPSGDVVPDSVKLGIKRNKAGKLTVVLDVTPPPDGTPLHVTLRLERAADEPFEDVVVLRRRTGKPER